MLLVLVKFSTGYESIAISFLRKYKEMEEHMDTCINNYLNYISEYAPLNLVGKTIHGVTLTGSFRN